MDAMTFAFSHNPGDLVDWIWVVLTFALVIAFVAIVTTVFVRWARARRRPVGERSRRRSS
jgi:branched-subunit amino acid permease